MALHFSSTQFIVNMVGVEETLELESSAENKLCPTFPY